MKNYLRNLVASDDSLTGLALRIPAGVIFFAHGSQKLFGAFGGYGLQATGHYMASIGLEPGYLMALLAGSGEFFGGIALLLGLLVRPAALVLSFIMTMAILSVHIHNGLFLDNGGYEFALALLGINVGLLFHGSGRFAVDRILDRRIKMVGGVAQQPI